LVVVYSFIVAHKNMIEVPCKRRSLVAKVCWLNRSR